MLISSREEILLQVSNLDLKLSECATEKFNTPVRIVSHKINHQNIEGENVQIDDIHCFCNNAV